MADHPNVVIDREKETAMNRDVEVISSEMIMMTVLGERRPFVILDPRIFGSERILIDTLRSAQGRSSGETDRLNRLAALVESVVSPRATAPKGIGAVVRDGLGTRWIRWAHDSHTHEAWQMWSSDDTTSRWEDLRLPISILQEGLDDD